MRQQEDDPSFLPKDRSNGIAQNTRLTVAVAIEKCILTHNGTVTAGFFSGEGNEMILNGNMDICCPVTGIAAGKVLVELRHDADIASTMPAVNGFARFQPGREK